MERRSIVRRYADVALAVVLAVTMLVEALGWTGHHTAVAVPSALLATLPVAMRRWQPVPAFLMMMAGMQGLERALPPHGLDTFDGTSVAFVVVFFLMLFSLGAHARGREV